MMTMVMQITPITSRVVLLVQRVTTKENHDREADPNTEDTQIHGLPQAGRHHRPPHRLLHHPLRHPRDHRLTPNLDREVVLKRNGRIRAPLAVAPTEK